MTEPKKTVLDVDACFIAQGTLVTIIDAEGNEHEASLVDMHGEVDGKPIVVIPEDEM